MRTVKETKAVMDSPGLDKKYGKGTAELFACAIEEFYKNKNISNK